MTGRKALVVAGARPNFMKVAPLLRALHRRSWRAVLVHTGQHFDEDMSDRFFADLGMAPPDHHLGVGPGSHAEQTARVMERFEPVVHAEAPDWVVVVGDVNSTLAAALVAAKLRPQLGTRLAHVEAGLRSGDWRMPEEVNRVVTDQLADLLLTHSPEAAQHLAAEGVPEQRIVFAGNVMIDSLFETLRTGAGASEPAWQRHGLVRGGYGLVTLHRPSNVDSPSMLAVLLEGLGAVSDTLPLIWPVHPRARARLNGFAPPAALRLVDPAGYRDMAQLLQGAAVVITDSGGLQEESSALGVPCVTLRETTERPITVSMGTNRMVPWPPTAPGIADAVAAARKMPRRKAEIPGWDGAAAERIVDALEQHPIDAGRCNVRSEK
ncbi:MAG: non-hydrolyzing UDP-N-acetylglucosamine 2-epimerase [Gemmatimonadales bacterium]